MKDCKVALVGAGRMARHHLLAFSDIPQVQLVGITSRTLEKAEALAQEFNINAIYKDIGDMYSHARPDLVIIVVSVQAIKEVTLACFHHPWTILIEKPFGLNLEEALVLIESAKARKQNTYVALNRRFYSSTRAALADIQQSSGKRFIRIQDQQNQIAALKAGHPAEVVNNWIFANSIHLIDYFLQFGRGKIRSVTPVTADRIKQSEPCFIVSKVDFDSGDVGLYEGIWNGPGPWAVTVTTEDGTLWELHPLEQARVQRLSSSENVTVPIHEWDLKFKAGLRLQAEEAVKAALGNSSNLVDSTQALRGMRLAHAILNGETASF